MDESLALARVVEERTPQPVEAAQLLLDDALNLGGLRATEAERVSQYGVHARKAGNVARAQR